MTPGVAPSFFRETKVHCVLAEAWPVRTLFLRSGVDVTFQAYEFRHLFGDPRTREILEEENLTRNR